MKKLLIILAALFTLTPLTAVTVRAQTNSVDDSQIEESLRERGLDQAPEEVKVEDSKMMGQEPSSGFVDENGNPLSDEEYNKIREDEKGANWQNIGLILGALTIIGGTAIIVTSILKKRK